MVEIEYLLGLTERQRRFIDLFIALFNVKDAFGNRKPFIPTTFQQEFLKDSILCNDKFINRIVNKGRGIGMTAVVAAECLIIAQLMKGITIPVSSISAKTANVLLEWAALLADTSNTIPLSEGPFKIDRDTSINSIIKLKNGSKIIPISGGSPNSVRSLRAPVLVLDEFAYCEYQSEILSAGERCLSEGGAVTIISTPRTSDTINDLFWKIYMNAENMNYKRYFFPIFPKGSVNLNKSLFEQNLKPIASWINMEMLEKDRSRDVLAFSKENLGEPMDESVAFLSWNLIKKCCILKEFQKPLPDYPIFLGIDVGRTNDLTAIIGFQQIDNKFYQVLLKTMRGVDLPQQSIEIQSLDKKYDFHNINIDSTGLGLGLYEFVKQEIGGKVHKVIFSKETKQKMGVNFRNLMQDERVFLLKEDNFMDILHSIPYDTLQGERTTEGHQDEFWACALALMRPSSRILNAGKMLDGFI